AAPEPTLLILYRAAAHLPEVRLKRRRPGRRRAISRGLRQGLRHNIAVRHAEALLSARELLAHSLRADPDDHRDFAVRALLDRTQQQHGAIGPTQPLEPQPHPPATL